MSIVEETCKKVASLDIKKQALLGTRFTMTSKFYQEVFNKKGIRIIVPNEQEHRGQEFLADDLNLGGTWIQTSYNGNIRGKYAGIGDIYDPVDDVFRAQEEDING